MTSGPQKKRLAVTVCDVYLFVLLAFRQARSLNFGRAEGPSSLHAFRNWNEAALKAAEDEQLDLL